MEATFFLPRDDSKIVSPPCRWRSPMPSALTTRALARIGPAAFVLLASRAALVGRAIVLHRREGFLIYGGGRGVVVAGSLFRSPAQRCFFPDVPGTGEVAERFCVPLFAFEGEGIVGRHDAHLSVLIPRYTL
ncbi:hypothetical protein TNCV_4460181 [Trichonephila clavipes]|nr:hypothetical protein TNCV_4460181 [Trichonephila clavipes]